MLQSSPIRRVARHSYYVVLRALARSGTVARLAARTRDAAGLIVALRHEDSPWVELSGERALLAAVGPHTRTFIDVGGNEGHWTARLLTAGGPEKRGLVFDPGSAALALLRARFAAYAGVKVTPAAVGAAEGEVTFWEEPGAGGTSSVVAGASQPGAVPRRVAVTTLEAACAEHGFDDVDVVKIDAEGWDAHVLRGAARLISERRIGVVQFEYTRAWATAGATLAGARTQLADAGYECFVLKRDGLYTPDWQRYGEHWGPCNVVAVRSDWGPRLATLVRGAL